MPQVVARSTRGPSEPYETRCRDRVAPPYAEPCALPGPRTQSRQQGPVWRSTSSPILRASRTPSPPELLWRPFPVTPREIFRSVKGGRSKLSVRPRRCWSGRPDLNRRPLPPQGSALPPALRPDGNNYSGNAESRKRRGRAVAQSFQFVKRGRGRAPSDWSAAGDSSPKGDLDVHVGTSEEPAEVTRFLPYPGRDASRYGGKLRNTDAETISLPG